jgi:photosystem II stability/assembly factor-like uncharacterized protein
MRVLQRLRQCDPLAGVDMDLLAQNPLFDELRDEIIATRDQPGPASSDIVPGPFGPRPARSRHRRQFLAATAAFIAVAGAIYTVSGSGSSNGETTTPFAPGRTLGSSPTTPSPSTGAWQLVSQLFVTGWQQDVKSGPPPGQLTCPSVVACYALSARYASAYAGSTLISESLYVSHDFGLTWSVLPLPSGFRPSARLSCSSDDDCAVPGVIKYQVVLIRTTDGGHQWTVATWKDQNGELTDLSCTSSTTCRAILEKPPGSKSSKSTSSSDKVLLPLFHDERSCSTWTSCTSILDRVARSISDTGLRSGGLGEPAPQSIVTTHDGGLSWTSEQLPRGEDLTTLACPTASECLALGIKYNSGAASRVEALNIAAEALRLITENALQSGNEMIGLPQYPIPPQFRASVAAIPAAISRYEEAVVALHLPSSVAPEVAAILKDCEAEKEDLALNAVGRLPVDQWNNHGTALTTAQQTLLEKLELQPFVRRTTNGGGSWTQRPLPVTDLVDSPLTCSGGSICATIGSPGTSPEVLVTTDDGTTWKAWKVAGDIPGPHLSGVACPTAGSCWVSGSAAIPRVVGNSHNSDSALIAGVTNDGQTWSPVSLPVPANAPDYDGQSYLQVGPITCPRQNACLALGTTAQGSTTAPVYRLLEGK